MQREQDFYDRSILIPSDDVAHTHLRKTTHTPSMLCHEWVECGHPTEWSQLASTWLASTLYCMLHVLAYWSNKRHWIIWVVLLYFTWELNKDFTVTEDPSRYPGIGPSTIQPQHLSHDMSQNIQLISSYVTNLQIKIRTIWEIAIRT
jgi:hypothetical protein